MAHSALLVKDSQTVSILRRDYVTHKCGKYQTGFNTRVTRMSVFHDTKKGLRPPRPSATCQRLECPLATATTAKVAHRQCPAVAHALFWGNGRLWLRREVAEQSIPDSGPVRLVADALMAPSQLAVTRDWQQKVNTMSNSKCNSVLLQLWTEEITIERSTWIDPNASPPETIDTTKS